MSVLMIGRRELMAMKEAVERARRKPLRFDYDAAGQIDQSTNMVTLADRERVGFERREYKSQQVLIPHGFRLAISFEQQPVGLCAHFSISLDNKPGALPNPEHVAAILIACGFPPSERLVARHWIEEFLIDGKPGGRAVNVVIVVAPAVVGHA